MPVKFVLIVKNKPSRSTWFKLTGNRFKPTNNTGSKKPPHRKTRTRFREIFNSALFCNADCVLARPLLDSFIYIWFSEAHGDGFFHIRHP